MRILLLFLLTSLTLSAQHEYQLFQPGVQYLYSNPDTVFFQNAIRDSQYYGVKVDSAGCQELYGTLRYYNEATHRLPSPFGYRICQGPDSTRMYMDSTRYFVLFTGEGDPDSYRDGWIAYTDDSLTVHATVTGTEQADFFGITDSVKTIAFSRADGSSLGTTRISKNYGLIGGRFFYDLTQPDPLPLAGMSNPEVGVQLPPSAAFNTVREGDVVHVNRFAVKALSPDPDDIWNVYERQIIEVESVDSTGLDKYGTPYTYYTARSSTFHYKQLVADPSIGRDSSLVLDTLISLKRRLLPDRINQLQPGARYLVSVDTVQRPSDTAALVWEEFRTLALFDGSCGLVMKRPTVNTYLREEVDVETEYPCVDCGAWGPTYAPYLPVNLEPTRWFYHWQVTAAYVDLKEVNCGTPFDFSDIIISTDDPFLSKLDRQVSIFPNPVDGLLTIELPSNGEEYQLRLLDSRGVEVRHLPRTRVRAEMEVTGLPSGVYILLVRDGRQLVGRRRVVVRGY
jgi:hypothetical protein